MPKKHKKKANKNGKSVHIMPSPQKLSRRNLSCSQQARGLDTLAAKENQNPPPEIQRNKNPDQPTDAHDFFEAAVKRPLDWTGVCCLDSGKKFSGLISDTLRQACQDFKTRSRRRTRSKDAVWNSPSPLRRQYPHSQNVSSSSAAQPLSTGLAGLWHQKSEAPRARGLPSSEAAIAETSKPGAPESFFKLLHPRLHFIHFLPASCVVHLCVSVFVALPESPCSSRSRPETCQGLRPHREPFSDKSMQARPTTPLHGNQSGMLADLVFSLPVSLALSLSLPDSLSFYRSFYLSLCLSLSISPSLPPTLPPSLPRSPSLSFPLPLPFPLSPSLFFPLPRPSCSSAFGTGRKIRMTICAGRSLCPGLCLCRRLQFLATVVTLQGRPRLE